MKYIFSFETGIFLCSTIRDYFKSLKFKGYDIDFIESKGILKRTFSVKGNIEDITMIKEALHKWGKENNLFNMED